MSETTSEEQCVRTSAKKGEGGSHWGPKLLRSRSQVHLFLNAMRLSGGAIGEAHGLAAETVPGTSEPRLSVSGGVRLVCPHKPQHFI